MGILVRSIRPGSMADRATLPLQAMGGEVKSTNMMFCACIIGGIGGVLLTFLSVELTFLLTSFICSHASGYINISFDANDYIRHFTAGSPMSYAGFMVRIFAAFAAFVGGAVGVGYGYHVGFASRSRGMSYGMWSGASAGALSAAGIGLLIAGIHISGSILYDAPPGMVVWFIMATSSAAGVSAGVSGALGAWFGAAAAGDVRE